MARDPVLQWAAQAQAASQAVGGAVPPSVLLGLTRIESGGREGLTSPTGAQGLTQFEPGTAAEYGVNVQPGHAQSQLTGAAKYLVALGFEKDPTHALAAYNGGPGNANLPQTRQYAQNVLSAAKSYSAFDKGGAGAAAAGGAASSSAPASSSPIIDAQQHSTLVTFGVGAGLVLVSIALIAFGAARTFGLRREATA